MIIIGVGHKARRGKDLVGLYLAENHGFVVKHFADALYHECRNCAIAAMKDLVTKKQSVIINGETVPESLHPIIFPWLKRNARNEREGTGYTSNLCRYTSYLYGGMIGKDAELLQWWGTDFRRSLGGENYWTSRIERTLRIEGPEQVVIPDLRFQNEAEWIQSMGGVCWKVHSSLPWEPTDRLDNHASEVDLDGWDGWDAVIENEAPSATEDDLHARIESLLCQTIHKGE